MKSSTLLAVAVAITCLSGNVRSKQSADDWKRNVRHAVEGELANSNTPSLQVSIGKNGKVIYQAAYGFSDVENKVAATNSSKYRIGSVSKWFTSTAVKSLIDDGVINPEALIQQYCSQYPVKKWPINVSSLLTHKSGIRHYIDYDSELQNAKTERERENIARDRDRSYVSSHTRYVDVVTALDGFKHAPLIFEPNTNWASSFGYRVLACVMEGATEMSYSDLMDDFIFKKANMNNTVQDDAWAIISGRTTGYRLNRNKTLRRADFRDTSENLPAGGHLSTASDLVSFAMALNSGAFSMSRDGRESNVWTFLNKGSIGQDASWRNAIPSEELYGVGEMYFPDTSLLWVGHTGRIAGGSAIVVLQPDSGLAIAVTTNAKGWNGYISFIDKLKLILQESNLP